MDRLTCRSPSNDSFTYDLEIPRRMHKSLATHESEPAIVTTSGVRNMQTNSNRNRRDLTLAVRRLIAIKFMSSFDF